MREALSHTVSPARGAWLAAVWLGAAAACSGAVSEGRDGDGQGGGGGGGGDQQIPIDPDTLKLDRIPGRELTCDDPQALATGQTPLVRLGTEEYANTLADLLRPAGVAKPAPLTALGHLRPGFASDSAFAASDDIADGQATQANDTGKVVAQNLAAFAGKGCPPAAAAGESACLEQFIDAFVMRAYRRPVAEDERARLRGLFEGLRKAGNSFADSMGALAEAVIQSPQFLYRLEFGDAGDNGVARLGGYEMASRVSYLLWGSMPDDELFAAAADGGLDSGDGISAQVTRLLADPRSRSIAGHVAESWLELGDRLPSASAAAKNQTRFSRYTSAVSDALATGLDLFIEENLMGEGGSPEKLLSDRRVFINKDSAWIYDLPAGASAEFAAVEVDDGRRRGLLTQGTILAALAGREIHAPVRRGVFVLERVLCMPPPPPPDDVVPVAPAPDASVMRTTRQRLIAEHEGQGGTCQSCHEVIDGVGFAFENYDAIGRWQDKEGSLPVDASAQVQGTYDADGTFRNAVELIDKLAPSEQVAQCFVQTFYRFALARELDAADGCNIAHLTDRLIDEPDGFRAVIGALARTPAFRNRSVSRP